MVKMPPTATVVMQDEVPGVVASAVRINAWAEIAKPGDEFVYASRCYMPVGADGARAARVLQTQGLGYLKQRKVANGLTNYVIERSSRAWNNPRAVPRVPTGALVTSEAAAIDALYRVLLRQAQYGRPCPTDAKLATLALIDLASVQPALAVMMETGLIRIKRVKAPTLRVVSIVATGHATGIIG